MNVATATSGDQTTWRKTDRLREAEAAGIVLTIAAVFLYVFCAHYAEFLCVNTQVPTNEKYMTSTVNVN